MQRPLCYVRTFFNQSHLFRFQKTEDARQADEDELEGQHRQGSRPSVLPNSQNQRDRCELVHASHFSIMRVSDSSRQLQRQQLQAH